MVRALVRRKFRPAFRILPQIKIVNRKLPVQPDAPCVLLLRKFQQHLVAPRPRRAVCEIAFFLIKTRQPVIHLKGAFKTAQQHRQNMGKLAAVIIQLDHFLHLFQTDHVIIGKPLRIEHLIGRAFPVYKPVFRSHFFHIGAFEHLQKAQLQLFRAHRVHIVERTDKAVHILIGQPRDQIQMHVDIVLRMYPHDRMAQPVEACKPPDLLKRLRISGLHADFQLHKPRAHFSQKRQLLAV